MKEIKSLDVNLLKALDALLKECNVTRAATRLGVTQPAMSGMLLRLREIFNDPLFVRAQRGMTPTKRAVELIQPVKKILMGIDLLLQPTVFDPATSERQFTIAATDYALRTIVFPFLSLLKQQAPHIKLLLIDVDEANMHQQLEMGEVDLALLTSAVEAPDIYKQHLFDEHYIGVMRSRHTLAKEACITLEQFCQQNHALVSYVGDPFWGVADTALQQLGLQRNVVLSVKSFLMLPEILQTDDFMAVAPSRLVHDIPELKTFKLPFSLSGFSKEAVWHATMHHDPAHQWLRELLFSSCA